jgi:hypothetical protein
MSNDQEQLNKEKETSTDMWQLAYILCAPSAEDDSEAEFERIEALGDSLVELEAKYGKNLVRDLYDLIDNAVDIVCTRISEGESNGL